MKAIVTGSSRGLGLAIAKKLAEEGNDVVITSRDSESAKNIENEIKLLNPKVEVYGHVVDFSNQKSVDDFVSEVMKKWGRIDILVNNVGIFLSDRITDDIEANLAKVLDVNLFSAIRMGKNVVDQMRKNKSGYIFNIISIAAKDLREDSATYSISKLALKGYNDLLREEVKKDGVKVIGIYPGPMNTSSWDDDDPIREKMIQMEEMTEIVSDVLKMSKNATMEEIVINLVQDL